MDASAINAFAFANSDAVGRRPKANSNIRAMRSFRSSVSSLTLDANARAAKAVLSDFDDGVFLVQLASVRQADQVPSAIADREPLEFEGFDGVSAEDLGRVARPGR